MEKLKVAFQNMLFDILPGPAVEAGEVESKLQEQSIERYERE